MGPPTLTLLFLNRSLSSATQLRLEEGPCLANLAKSTAQLGDFEAVKTALASDSSGVMALAEVLWGVDDVEKLYNDQMQQGAVEKELRVRVLQWAGLPTGSTKENVAYSYLLVVNRLKEHSDIFGNICKVLAAKPTAKIDDVAAFLTTPYKATFEAIR